MNIIERKSASRKGTKAAVSSKGGKFQESMKRLAKLRSASRSKSPLQVGNVLTKKAFPSGTASFGSKVTNTGDKSATPVQATEGQTALNPNQPGKSNKNMQKGKRF